MNASLPVLLEDGQRKYVWGQGLAYAVDSSGVLVYHSDGLGSVRALTDASGTVVQTYRYDEYGVSVESQGTIIQPFGYTGEQWDAETGLLYLRARMYDAGTGRFVSRDTAASDGHRPQSINRYGYAEGDPVNLTDPTGNNPFIGACAAGAAISVTADLLVGLAGGEKLNGSQVLRSAGTGCVTGLAGFGIGKLVSKGVAALAGAVGPRIGSGATTNLYRAVGNQELADILNVGGFRQAAGGQSMEAKLFAETLADAEWWGNQLYGRAGSEFHVVQVRIPTSFAQQLDRIPGDSRVITAVDSGLLQQFNSVAK